MGIQADTALLSSLLRILLHSWSNQRVNRVLKIGLRETKTGITGRIKKMSQVENFRKILDSRTFPRGIRRLLVYLREN